MAVTILGSAALAAGGTYTPNTGTANRLLIAFAFGASGTPPTLTNIVYNGVTRTPALTNTWSTSVLAIGACIFLDTELSASAQTVTPTWSSSPSQNYLVCVTLDGAAQSTTPDAVSAALQTTGTSTISQSISPITVGDMVLGFSLNRGGLTVTDTTTGWSSLQSALIPSGSVVYDVSDHTATATSDTYALSFTGTADFVASLLAIAVATGGGTTLTAATGSFALTGEAATFSQGAGSQTILAATGAFDVNGASSLSGLTVVSSQGQFALNGQNANLIGPNGSGNTHLLGTLGVGT